MPRIYSGDPDKEFQRLRREGRAGLPRDPLRQSVDRREMLNTARMGSFADDVANLEGQISRGRQLLESRGFRDLSQKNLATAGPDTIEAIGDMRRRRTANTISGGGMGNSQVAWPKFRDPFEQFREKAWWFLKEGEFSQSLKKVREWCNTPDAPIWMADGTFKAIGEINVGEEVMGWEWTKSKGGHWHKTLRPSRVLATNRREAPMVVEVELASGHKMRCTPDHKWANPAYLPDQEFDEYGAVEVGSNVLNFSKGIEGYADEVVSIVELGPGEVVSMQTETGNYVAWSIASKNCRLMYMTHPLVPSLIDIYARFPLLDIEFKHQDKKLCTPAETPIWMGDYSFKPISEIVVGDEVIGWDRSDGKAKLKRVKVTKTYRYEKQAIIKATTNSGRTIRCTPEHKWANYFYSPGRQSRPVSASYEVLENRRIEAARMFAAGISQKKIAERLDTSPSAVSIWHKAWKLGGEAALRSKFVVNRAGEEQRYAEWTTAFVGAKLKHVIDPTPELSDEKERLVAAWLGGVYDGEGSGKWIAQSQTHNPDVYERIIDSLNFLGFRTYESRQGHNIGFHQPKVDYSIHQSRQDLTNFLNWTNPTRRVRKQTDKSLLAGNWGAEETIVSVEDDGAETVYAIETESGNYVAWGFASSNSDFYNDLFLNELNYQDFLYDMSKEFWTCGEAFALGSWHEGIGAWDDDELINPDDVIVSRNSVLRQYQFHLKVPEGIKKLIETRQPRQEYEMLVKFYPYILQWAQQNREIPVSDVLMKQLKFKCVVGSTSIMTPTGPARADSLDVGDEVVAWDEKENKFITSRVSHTGLRDPEPIHWVTTRSGRKVGATADHPFWTKNGWVEAADLKVGDEVYVALDYDLDDEGMDVDVARFLGLMVGDGSCSQRGVPPQFHNVDDELLTWVDSFVSNYGCRLRSIKNKVGSFTLSQGPGTTSASPNLISHLLNEHGMLGENTYTKKVPTSIWRGGSKARAAFLSGYFDTDGYFDKKNCLAIWDSVSKELIEGCQALLASLGISSRIDHISRYNGYRLTVGKKYIGALSEVLSPMTERKQLLVPSEYPKRLLSQEQAAYVRQQLVSGRSGRSLAHEFNVSDSIISQIKYEQTYSDNSAWDVVRSVEIGEAEPTIALGIADYHTHITAGLVTHNTNPWEPHGVPILMRGFKVLMLEMSLEAAQDAVADRLYSPLILAKLGIEDIADGEGPWIPEPEELDALRDDLSLALMSDFRLMVYHHGLQIDSVFGREHMPRLDYDFDRIDGKLMQIFGIGPELLQGGKSSAPYASGALNRELITQMLSTYQNSIKRFIRSRAEVVAERQGHFEFEKRGGQRFPIYETTLMLDEETGEEYIEERPKLAVPDVSFRTMNLRDEMTERQFLMQLKASGIPISDESLMVNIPFEFEDEVLKLEREKTDKVIAELNYQKRLFTSIYLNRLPIPPEYYQAYIQFLSGIQGVALASSGTDVTSAAPTPNLFPMSQPTQGDMNNAMMVEQMNAEEMLELPMYRPAISDEQRADAPKKASLRMYASKEEVEEMNRLGFDAFMDKLGGISTGEETESYSETLDITDEEPLPWHRESSSFEPTEEMNARRIDGIKSMASPGHMRLRKKMTLPSSIRYSQAPEVQEEIPSDSERPVERESEVLDDGNESTE